MTQPIIFLSSTCLDLVDLRSGLKESLEEMGYKVWASEFADFPVDSRLHAQDNCLRNVERADQYVLIVNAATGRRTKAPPIPSIRCRRIRNAASVSPGTNTCARSREECPSASWYARTYGTSGASFRRRGRVAWI